MNMPLDNKTSVFQPCSSLRADVQLHQQLVAASFGGAISAIVIKTRLQIAPSVPVHPRFKQQVFSGTTDAFVKIIRNEGIFTLWRGLAPSLIMTVPNAAIYFNSYEYLKRRIISMDFPYQTLVPLMAGAVARVIAVATLAPLELIRTNFQAQQKERTVLSFVQKTGLRGLWLGVGATLSRDVPFSAIYWSCYEYLKSEMKSEIPQTTSGAFITSFLCGCTSGMLSAILTTPIDLVKTRVQTRTHDPNHAKKRTAVTKGPAPTAREIARIIYVEEGFKGFMRGWLPRAVKVGPACAIMISSYEFIKSIGTDRCG